MTWANPVKTARLCFFNTGHLKEHHAGVDDCAAVDQLVTFLRDSHAVIVDLENFSDEEIETLKKVKSVNGDSLFASPGCFRGHVGSKGLCMKLCLLKSDRHSLADCAQETAHP